MNKKDFISLLDAPELLGKQHIPSLRSVAADFPYFQTAHILLAKALYNEKHYEFEKQLKHVSVMSPDRAVLFRFIHNINAPVELEIPTGLVSTHTHSTAEATPEPAIPLPKETSLLADHEEKTTHDTPESSIESVSSEEQVAETLIVLEPAVSSEETPSVSETESAVEPEKQVATVSASETHSFAEWLMMQQKLKIVPDSIPLETTVEITVSTPIEHVEEEKVATVETREEPSIQEEIAQQVIRSNVNEFESILDKFIRENPRISRGKAEFYNPVNMAKQSVEENDEVVTETLANIYYKQGHYKKAIRVYEKLCLIYPHKMPYFASLIQKIKTENKD